MVNASSPMLSHVLLGSNDLPQALEFHGPILEALGWVQRYLNFDEGLMIWQPPGGERPWFGVGRAFDGQPAVPGNGGMTALVAPNRATVREVYLLAMRLGATDEGKPGLRPHYHPNYYGAYFRDRDGNKLCVCCHGSEAECGQ